MEISGISYKPIDGLFNVIMINNGEKTIKLLCSIFTCESY